MSQFSLVNTAGTQHWKRSSGKWCCSVASNNITIRPCTQADQRHLKSSSTTVGKHFFDTPFPGDGALMAGKSFPVSTLHAVMVALFIRWHSCALHSCFPPSGGYLPDILSRGNIFVLILTRLNMSHTLGTVSPVADHPGRSSPHLFEAECIFLDMHAQDCTHSFSSSEIKINSTFSCLYRDEG